MPWNPNIYNEFKNIRNQPFFDLMECISADGLKNGVDIGCGTGEQTHILSEKFKDVRFLGIDSSSEMLAESVKFQNKQLNFKNQTIENFCDLNEKWDLVFSNAALQWVDHHYQLFPKLLSMVNEGGQFAVQMPFQTGNVLNKILFRLASEEPYKTMLGGWNIVSPVLSLDEYSKMMFDAGLRNLEISIKVYPIIADDADRLFTFISGSALIPYLEKLDEEIREDFVSEFKRRIATRFERFPAIYAFKRILLYGRK